MNGTYSLSEFLSCRRALRADFLPGFLGLASAVVLTSSAGRASAYWAKTAFSFFAVSASSPVRSAICFGGWSSKGSFLRS